MVKELKSKVDINRDDFVSWSNGNEGKIKDAVLNYSEEFEALFLELSDIINTIAFSLYAKDKGITLNEAMDLIGEWHVIQADELFA